MVIKIERLSELYDMLKQSEIRERMLECIRRRLEIQLKMAKMLMKKAPLYVVKLDESDNFEILDEKDVIDTALILAKEELEACNYNKKMDFISVSIEALDNSKICIYY
ncbi:MAG TPA: hypothetical protein VK190_03390 [Pseudoneobacillus sp.]|nr:hypothetical protein [Pseudoneobacillus sp.]